MITYLYIFLQSNLLEVPFYSWILGRSKKNPVSHLVPVTAINSLTHPIVFFVLMNLKNTYLTNILVAESFAVLAETAFFVFLQKQEMKRAFTAALGANLISWQLAPMLTYLIHLLSSSV